MLENPQARTQVAPLTVILKCTDVKGLVCGATGEENHEHQGANKRSAEQSEAPSARRWTFTSGVRLHASERFGRGGSELDDGTVGVVLDHMTDQGTGAGACI